MRRLVLAALLVHWVVGPAAASNFSLGYQGQLRQNGVPVTGNRSVVFKIYPDATSGTPAWTSAAQTVTFTNGLFFSTFTPTGVDWEGTTPVLEVEVDGTPLSPREELSAMPYAFNAQHLGGKKYTSAASAPGSPAAGDLWYDTGALQLKFWNGAAWVAFGGVTTTIVSDPTQFSGDGSPAQPLTLRSSSVTLQGNLVNVAGGLVKLDGTGGLPTVTGAALTGTLTMSGAAANIVSGASITASAFFGDGSNLAGVTASNVAAANVQPGVLGPSVIASSVAVGAVGDEQLAGGVAQSKIANLTTDLGVRLLKAGDTMTGPLTMSGATANIVSGASVTASAFFGDGSALTGIVASSIAVSAVGNEQLAGGIAQSKVTNLTSDLGARLLKAGDTMSGQLTMSGAASYIVSGTSITASAFFGDGSALTGVTASNVAAANVQAGSLGPGVIASSAAVGSIGNEQLAGGIAQSKVTNLTSDLGARLLKAGDTMSGQLTMSGAASYIVSGTSITASAFFGDGSGLTGVSGTDVNRVAKTGDTMTGQLTVAGSSVTIVNPSIVSNPWSLGVTTSTDRSTFHLVVATNGRVGLGTAAPAAQFHLVGDEGLGGASIRLTNTATIGRSWRIAAGGAVSSYFSIDDISGAGGNRLQIDSVGNVGININPNNKLSVGGSVGIGSGAGFNVAGPANGLIVEGSVGVGTPAPAAKLDVNGSAQLGSGATKSTFSATGALALARDAGLVLSGGAGNVVTGASVTASAFFGDGSNLTGVSGTDSSRVAKTGDTMTGQLTVSGSSVAILGATTDAFSLAVTTSPDRSQYHLHVSTSGEVGVGTAQAVAGIKLRVAGNLQVDNELVASAPTTAGDPSYTFLNDNNTGLFQPVADVLGVTAGGAEVGRFGAGGLDMATNMDVRLTGASGYITSQSSVNASAFFGDGAGLTNVAGTDSTKVAKTGDMMSGQLTIGGSSMTITGPQAATTTEMLRLTKIGFGGSIFKQYYDASTAYGLQIAGTEGRAALVTDTSVSPPRVGVGDVLLPKTTLDVNGNAQFGSGAAKSTFTTTGALQLARDAGLTLTGANGNITTGSSVTASAFFGDGSGLTGIDLNSRVAKAGDTMTGQLTLAGGSSMTVTGAARAGGVFNVGVGPFQVNSQAGEAQLGLNLFEDADDDVSKYQARQDWLVSATQARVDWRVRVPGDSGTASSRFLFNLKDGRLGVGTTSPETPLDVNGAAQFGSGAAKSTFTTTGALQLARDAGLTLTGANGNITTGSSVTASAFFGDGAGLTNVSGTDSTKVAKIGDFISGQLTTESTITIKGNAFSVGGSTFVVTAGRVGVGTQSPTWPLSVSGNAAAVSALRVTGRSLFEGVGTDIGFFEFYPSASGVSPNRSSQLTLNAYPVGAAQTQALTITASRENDQVTFGSSASGGGADMPFNFRGNQLFLATSGRTGLGTGAPQAKLDVEGDAQFGSGVTKSTFSSAGALGLARDAGLTLSGASGNITTASSVTASAFFGDGSGLTNVSGTDSTKVIKAGDTITGTLNLNAAGTDLDTTTQDGVTIDTHVHITNGNLGIGTTNPLAPLHLFSGGTASYARIQGATDGDNYSGFELWSNDAAPRKWQFVHKAIAGQTYDFNMAHFNGTSWTTPIVIKTGGNVGIGVPAPVANLHVSSAGIAAAESVLLISSGTAAGQELFVVKGDGRVGVGAANPAARLTVAGGNAEVINDGGSPWLRVGDTGNDNVYMQWNSAGNYGIVRTQQGGAEAGNLALQPSVGNVGIGTTDPLYKLHVSSGQGPLARFSAPNAGLFVYADDAAATFTGSEDTLTLNASRVAAGNTTTLRVAGQQGIEFAVDANSVRAVIDSAGNFGVGTSTPLAWLPGTIQRSLHADGWIVARGNGSNSWADLSGRIGVSSSTTGGEVWYFSANSDGKMAMHQGGIGDRLTIDAGGNVGIGVVPTAKLHVGGTSGVDGIRFPDGTLMTSAGAGSASNLANTVDAVVNADSDANNTGAVRLQTKGTDRLVIDNAGNVGVGLAAPDGLLHSGSAIFSYPKPGTADHNSLVLSNNMNATIRIRHNAGLSRIHTDPGQAISLATHGQNDRVNVDVDGDVGVGAATPSARLHVSSASALAGDAVFLVSSGTAAGQELLVVKGDGKVGIGTTSPASSNGSVDRILNVNGEGSSNTAIVAQSGAASGSSAGGIFEARSNLPVGGDARLGQIGFGRLADVTAGRLSSFSDIYVNNDGTLVNAIRIQPNGSVGLGVTPTAKLHIGGVSGVDGIRFPDGTLMTSAGAGSASNLANAVDVVVNADSDANSTGAIRLQTKGLDRLVVDNAGNVGVGTATPSVPFHVRRDIDGTLTALRLANLAGGASSTNELVELVFGLGDGTSDFGGPAIWAGKEGDYTTAAGRDAFLAFGPFLNDGRSEAMRINSAGNLGVGATNPLARVHVAGAASASTELLRLQSNTNSAEGSAVRLGFASQVALDGVQRVNAAIEALTTGVASSHYGELAFRTMNATVLEERMRIDTAGRVGIGIAAPLSRLHLDDGRLQVGTSLWITSGTWAAPATPDTVSQGERLVFYQGGGWKTAIGMHTANGIWTQAHVSAAEPAFEVFSGVNASAPASRLSVRGDGMLHVKGPTWDPSSDETVRLESTKASLVLKSTLAGTTHFLLHSGSDSGGTLQVFSGNADTKVWTARMGVREGRMDLNGTLVTTNNNGISAKNTASTVGNLIKRNASDETIVGESTFTNPMRLQAGGALFVETATGGNVPHNCTNRTNTAVSNNAAISVSCAAGERVMGGGGNCDDGSFRASYPSSNTAWSLICSTSDGLGSNDTVYAVCCEY